MKEGFVDKVRQGASLAAGSVASTQGDFGPSRQISIKDSRGNILAVGRALRPSEDFSNPESKEKLFNYTRVI